jgi:repressor LexA
MGFEKINEYKKKNGLTNEDIARLSGVPKPTIDKITSGATRSPNLETVRAIAKALGLTLDDFSDDEKSSYLSIPGILPVPRMVKKPRLGTIACGDPILAVENHEGYDDVPDNINCDFTLICKGDSMIGARIHDGDVVYIRQQPDIENNEIAAVIIDEEAVTLKRVFRDIDHLVLMAENPTYPPIVVNGGHTARIIGKAVGFTSIIV